MLMYILYLVNSIWIWRLHKREVDIKKCIMDMSKPVDVLSFNIIQEMLKYNAFNIGIMILGGIYEIVYMKLEMKEILVWFGMYSIIMGWIYVYLFRYEKYMKIITNRRFVQSQV